MADPTRARFGLGIQSFACGFVLLLAGCGEGQADREIAVQVDQQLANSPVLGDAQIDVAARDGVVLLTGVVATEQQVESAEQLAWSVEGVEAVESRLRVSASAGEVGLPPVGAPPVPSEEPAE